MARNQHTLRRDVEIEGAGLHSGSDAVIRVRPAAAGSGITFFRRDRGDIAIPASFPFLRGSSFATTLARGGEEIATVEHLLAALHGLEIDNASIEVDGPEVPILDGSALPFAERLLEAGLRRQNAPRRYLGLRRPVAFRKGDRAILALPSNELRIT